jgi:hypothetical protein
MICLKKIEKLTVISSAIITGIIASTIFNPSISHAKPIKKIEWSTSAGNLNLRGRLDQNFTFNCPSGGQTGSLWGTDLYTDDSSICTAAAHSGLITVRDGGIVTIKIKPGFDFYNGTNRNDITSNGYPKFGGSFILVDRNGRSTLTETPIKIIDWGTSAGNLNLRGKLGQKFTFSCQQNGQAGSLWGTDLYTDDSSVCTAAAHKGIISTKNGGKVTIIIQGGSDSYQGSKRNGLTSNSYRSFGGSFSFVPTEN